MVCVWKWMSVSWQWYVLIGSAVTFIVGYASSVAFAEQRTAAETVTET
jgi:hypothetical protein